LTLGVVTLLLAAVATTQASTPQWAAYGLGSLYLVPIILSAISSGPYAAVAAGAVATAVSSVLLVGEASLEPRAVLLGAVFRGVGYVGVGMLVAIYARSLHRLAYQDILTGLPNRRAFFEHLSERLAQHHPVAVVVCDVDGLKAINDRAGHAAGDAAITMVGHRLVAALGPGAFVARVGGDEFLAVIPTAPPAELAIPGASVGAAACLAPPVNLDQLIARADADLYRAKQCRHASAAAADRRVA
jgi:GGDEF domain-containing protein